MDDKKTIVGISIFFTFVILGGLVGVFAGSFLCDRVEAKKFEEAPLKVSEKKSIEEQETKDEIEEQKKDEEVEKVSPIEISNRENIQQVLDIWKEIVQRTAEGKLGQKEATKLIYEMTSDVYKRNIPESFCVFRLKNIVGKNDKGQLKELNYATITYDNENIVYVDAIENYENDIYPYKLKFVKENNNWCFLAQLDQ